MIGTLVLGVHSKFWWCDRCKNHCISKYVDNTSLSVYECILKQPGWIYKKESNRNKVVQLFRTLSKVMLVECTQRGYYDVTVTTQGFLSY